jgi:TonB-dependent starch-binding outer membrane protein SusC
VHDNPLRRADIFRTGEDFALGWNASGGGQNYGYALTFGREGGKGTLPNSGLDKINTRSNFNWIPDSRLTIDAGIGLVRDRTQLPNLDNSVSGWIAGGLLGSPLTRTDRPYNSNDGWFGFNRQYNALASINNQLRTSRVIPSFTANYVPVSWFTNRVVLGADVATDRQSEYYPKNDSSWYTPANYNTGYLNQEARNLERYTADYLGNLRRTAGKNNQWEGNLSFGMQVVSTKDARTRSTGLGFVTNSNNVNQSAATTSGWSYYTEQKQYGYLSQLQIGFNNRIFLQTAVRIDKNSSFGEKAPTFVLPKVGATWTLSEEPFFQGVTSLINTMRVRASWGTTGRSPRPGDALTTLVAAPFNLTGTTFAGAVLGNPGNADLKPERGTEFEAGIDASFWRDRVTTEITYFNKKTTDLIIQKPIPPSLGIGATNNPLANIGEVVNRGLEVALNVNAVQAKNFGWDIRAGVNTLHNELTDLGGVAPFLTSGRTRAMKGEQVGVYVSKKILAIDDASGVVTVSDTLTPVGNLYPTLEWNITNSITLMKNLRISALLDSKNDFVVDNFRDWYTETLLIHSQKRLDPTVLPRHERLRRYGNDAPGKPAFVTVSGLSATTSDVYEAFIQPGDFLRFRELSATLTVPQRFLHSLGNRIDNASITFAMQNLKLWTDYEGPDPEVIAQNGNFDRQDFFSLPTPRRAMLRLNLTF